VIRTVIKIASVENDASHRIPAKRKSENTETGTVVKGTRTEITTKVKMVVIRTVIKIASVENDASRAIPTKIRSENIVTRTRTARGDVRRTKSEETKTRTEVTARNVIVVTRTRGRRGTGIKIRNDDVRSGRKDSNYWPTPAGLRNSCTSIADGYSNSTKRNRQLFMKECTVGTRFLPHNFLGVSALSS